LHGEDVFAVYLADWDGDAHVGLVEDGIGLDGCEGWSEKELGSYGVVASGGCASLLLAGLLASLLLASLLSSLLSSLLLTSLRLTILRLCGLHLACHLPPELITCYSTTGCSSSGAAKVACSTTRVLENPALRDTDGN
jgi:hypothetical protein